MNSYILSCDYAATWPRSTFLLPVVSYRVAHVGGLLGPTEHASPGLICSPISSRLKLLGLPKFVAGVAQDIEPTRSPNWSSHVQDIPPKTDKIHEAKRADDPTPEHRRQWTHTNSHRQEMNTMSDNKVVSMQKISQIGKTLNNISDEHKYSRPVLLGPNSKPRHAVPKFQSCQKSQFACLEDATLFHDQRGNHLTERIMSLEIDEILKPYKPNDKVTFHEWFKKFEDFREQQTVAWTDEMSVKKLRLFLEGEARERLMKFARDPSAAAGEIKFRKYADICKDLLDSYRKNGGQAVARSELSVLKQKPEESVPEFIERLTKVVTRLDPDASSKARESRIFEELLARLRDDIAEPLRLSIPENLQQAKAKALAIESIRATEKSLKDKCFEEGLALAVQALTDASMLNRNCSSNATTDELPRREKGCYYCGRIGHYIRECQERMEDHYETDDEDYYENRDDDRDYWSDSQRHVNTLAHNLPSQTSTPEVSESARLESLRLLQDKRSRLLKEYPCHQIIYPRPL